MENQFTTPILLNTFNRPQETIRVLEVLKENKVPVLYIHNDGPRDNRDDDADNVSAVREILDKSITWECEVHRLYEEKNLGCGMGPYTAMNWFFSNVEEGIIIEDDCVPHKDFFMYCQELLEEYRNRSDIVTIGGTCRHPVKRSQYSYHFSAFSEIWGWATWKRVWDEYDFGFSVPDEDFVKSVRSFTHSKQVANHWLTILHRTQKDGSSRSYWDFQLDLKNLYTHKTSIVPNSNLVSNIGFNERGTHTLSASSCSELPTFSILPLKHPKKIKIRYLDNFEYDARWNMIKYLVKKCLGR